MNQGAQPGSSSDQTSPSNSYGQPYPYQSYQPPSGYPPQYYYQPLLASPPRKGLSNWARVFVGLSLVTICAIVIIGVTVSATKTSVINPTIVPGSRLIPKIAVPTSVLDSDWTNYEPANAGFSLALPPSWQPLDRDTVKPFLEQGLKQLQDKNSQISSSLATQVQTVFASSYIKFFGFDSLNLGGFATNVNVLRQAIGASITLDAYVKLNLSQIGTVIKLAKPVEQKKASLAVGEAVQLQYQWDLTVPATGQPVNITTLQYMLIYNKNAYIVTFTGLTDELEQNLPLFTKIMDTFRLTN
jgi:hypothetical protein